MPRSSTKPVDKNDVARALRADGLATTLGGILNSFPYTCFAENVGLVRLTKVKSRYVVATAGLFMMIIGIFPKVGAVVAAIPPPVLGGAGICALRHRCRGRHPDPAPGGLPRRAQRHHPRGQPGFAIAPTVYPTITNGFPEAYERSSPAASPWAASPRSCSTWSSTCGVATSNLVTKVLPTPQRDEVFTIDQVNQMDREQFVAEFGALFQGSPWIAEQAYAARPFEDVYDAAQGLPRRALRGAARPAA